ncbi:hypothetical protein [Paratractidigestivibacter sp.]|uniref:hypothetical protein n=1 Tax=Paratractidigestivibacter sp. TaxID=2847316 RepID=UPI002ABD6508|nr:hypothetical protein [Paratractidigestivibacter sp.]
MSTNNEQVRQLNENELEQVNGGHKEYQYADKTGKYYKAVGARCALDWNNAYLCPRCGNPVHRGMFNKFYCDPCDCNWYFEYHFANSLNLSNGFWKEIAAEEYYRVYPEVDESN